MDQLVPTITKSLDDYWTSQSSKLTAPTITAGDATTGDGSDGGVLSDSVTYQPSDNTVHYDAATLQNVHDNIGDFGSGMLIATAWASSVEHQLGATVGSDDARRGAECLAGAWAANTSSSLSPGDLDEAVTVLVVGRQGRRFSGGWRSRDGLRPSGGVPCGVQARSVEVRAVELTPSPQLERGSGACATTHTPRSSFCERIVPLTCLLRCSPMIL